jgi:hypothetical protein
MKTLNLLIWPLAAISLISCGSGSSSNSPAEGVVQYDLQNYSLTVRAQTNNCTLAGDSTLNCDSKGIFGGEYTISFSTPEGKPGAYVVMPPEGNTYGLNITSTGSGCDQTASKGGETYTCMFRIGANGTAQAGNTMYLKINGTLGSANIVRINIQ